MEEEEEEDTNDSVLRSTPNWNIQVGFAGETMASPIGRNRYSIVIEGV